jgi:hypothetical protein
MWDKTSHRVLYLLGLLMVSTVTFIRAPLMTASGGDYFIAERAVYSSLSWLHSIGMATIGDNSSVVQTSTTSAALGHPRRKIVILGPHDRYNFGDLLFEKVIAKLLQTRAGYHDDDILRGGLISVNMTQYGGPAKVISMKRIQHMSRTDTQQGPYDIVYSGGEALGCSHACGVSMLPREHQQQALDKKVCDCAYLFPKDLLLPLNPRNATLSTGGGAGDEATRITLLKEQGERQGLQQRPKNYAIINSVHHMHAKKPFIPQIMSHIVIMTHWLPTVQ